LNLHGRKVIVNDGNVEKALRKFKKKIQNSGLLQDLKERETYTKPTTRRKTAKSQARRRWQKHLQTQQLPPKQY
jgi:small subunit ribosomal protein S21